MNNKGLLQIYADNFRDSWELPALSLFGDPETLYYSDFSRRIARFHLLLKLAGIRPGDKVALLGKNTPAWVTVFMGTITYGATIVPILHDFTPNDLQHIINHSDANILFVSERIFDTLDFNEMPKLIAAMSLDSRHALAERDMEKQPLAKIVRNLTRKFKQVYRQGFNREDVKYIELPKDHVAVLNYTSGTTGFSKGVMLTLDNLAGNVVFGIEQNLHTRGSRCLSFLPLAHAYGCAFDMLVPLAVGAHITLFGRTPTPRLLLEAMSKVKPNLIVTVPLILEKIYKKQIVPMLSKQPMRWALAIPFLDDFIFGKIRKRLIDAFGGEFIEVIVGGAPLNREVEDFLYKIKFPFTVGYGMTECGPLISYSPYKKFILHSAGQILPGIMEGRIDNPNGEEGLGEICVKGQNVMKGYYKNPEATAAVIDSDGWLHTGDMGTIDENNIVFIKGRNKTMILSSSGQNIYPEEIEAKLNNMPYVGESLVIERGAGLIALVYPDFETADANGVKLADMDNLMNQNRIELNKIVAPYEQIQEIRLVPNEFEKTPKKSIKRYLYNV